MSVQRTVTKCTLQMEPSTAIPEATSGKAVSNATMLRPRPHQHIGTGSHQVSQTCATACPNHSTNTKISCTCDPRTKPYSPSFYTYSHGKGHPSAYTHLYTRCSTCATTKVRLCPHTAPKCMITEM